MKKRIIYILLFLLILPKYSFSQIYSCYIVKSLNESFIIDKGANSGIQTGLQFKIYYHIKGKDKSKTKNDITLLGIAEVIQTFDDAAVLIFSQQYNNIKIKDGYYISLIPSKKDNPDTFIPTKIEKQTKNKIVEPIKRKSITKTIKSKDNDICKMDLSNAISIGFVGGFENFPRGVSNKIEDYLRNDIYTYGVIIDKSLPFKGGINASFERYITRFLSIRLNYGNLRYNRFLSSKLPFDLDTSTLPESYVKNWRFKIRTTINAFSLNILTGNFGILKDFSENNSSSKGFIFYGGFGPDYASFNYSTNETITLHRYNRDDVIYDETEHSLNGYWGVHGILGISYIFPALRVYVEGGYLYWNKKTIKNSYPFRLGLAFHF